MKRMLNLAPLVALIALFLLPMAAEAQLRNELETSSVSAAFKGGFVLSGVQYAFALNAQGLNLPYVKGSNDPLWIDAAVNAPWAHDGKDGKAPYKFVFQWSNDASAQHQELLKDRNVRSKAPVAKSWEYVGRNLFESHTTLGEVSPGDQFFQAQLENVPVGKNRTMFVLWCLDSKTVKEGQQVAPIINFVEYRGGSNPLEVDRWIQAHCPGLTRITYIPELDAPQAPPTPPHADPTPSPAPPTTPFQTEIDQLKKFFTVRNTGDKPVTVHVKGFDASLDKTLSPGKTKAYDLSKLSHPADVVFVITVADRTEPVEVKFGS